MLHVAGLYIVVVRPRLFFYLYLEKAVFRGCGIFWENSFIYADWSPAGLECVIASR